MKKWILLLFLSCILLLFIPPLQAEEERPFRIDWYAFEGAQGLGFKYQFSPHFFLTVNRERYPFPDLSIQFGTNLYLPQRLFFLSFYGGGGFSIDVHRGQKRPYLLTGIDAAILFVETLYFFDDEGLKSRQGLRFSF